MLGNRTEEFLDKCEEKELDYFERFPYVFEDDEDDEDEWFRSAYEYDIWAPDIGERGFMAIIRSKTASSLVELSLNCWSIITFSQETLDSFSAIINKGNLKILRLRHCRRSDELTRLFTMGDNAIEEFTSFEIDFDDNQLVKLLSHLPVLKKLKIPGNSSVTHDFPKKWFQFGGEAAEMVGKRRKLRPLQVDCNRSALCADYLNRKWGRWWSFKQKRCRQHPGCASVEN